MRRPPTDARILGSRPSNLMHDAGIAGARPLQPIGPFVFQEPFENGEPATICHAGTLSASRALDCTYMWAVWLEMYVSPHTAFCLDLRLSEVPDPLPPAIQHNRASCFQ